MQNMTKKRNGVALIVCMAFVAIFTAFAVGMIDMADNNVQVADNQHSSNQAFAAAQSGLDCGKYYIATVTGLPSTGNNTVSSTEATAAWNTFCSYVQAQKPGGKTVPAATSFTDTHGSGTQLLVPSINYGTLNSNFTMRFYRYTSDVNTIKLEVVGTDGGASKKINVGTKITKSKDVLKYAISSKTRIWVTGDSTIHGNIYSSWKYQNISPFDLTSTTVVDGTIGTILSNIKPSTGLKGPDLYAGTTDSTKMPYHLETLDNNGNPVYDISGNKVINSTDSIRGQSKGVNYNVNYGEKATNMPGMDLADYDTSTYKNVTTAIPDATYKSGTVAEYFPHNANDYAHGPSGSLKIIRNVCENKTLTNAKVVAGKNGLFKNCTF
ncbi:MAG TPA: hypothetical protein VIJ25_00480, partial [Methylococcales bacterium]